MKYMLMIYVDEAGYAKASKEQVGQMMAAYGTWTEAMRKAGVFVAADRLEPAATAATVRAGGPKGKVLDGPYADTKEQLGGFYILNVPDRAAALSWAAQCPSLAAGNGSVEVRPVMAM